MRIIIADDEPNIIKLLTRMIDPSLAEISAVAENGQEAYDRICESHPDVLITDVRMPGLSGLELIERAKTFDPNLEIIVISGYREFDYIQGVLKFGVQEFLLKPVEAEELNAALVRIMQKKNKNDQHNEYVVGIENHLNISYEFLREEYTMKILFTDISCLNDRRLPHNLFSFAEGNYAVGVLKIDCISDLSENMPYIRTLMERYRTLIIKTFQNSCFELTSTLHGNHVFFIFNYSHQLSENEFWYCQGFNLTYLKDMLVTDNYKYHFLLFTIGIGVTVDNSKQIGTSLRSAMHALGNRLNAMNNGVIMGTVPLKDTDAVHLPAVWKTTITNNLTAINIPQVLQAYREITNQFLLNSGHYWFLPVFVTESLDYIRHTVLYHNILEDHEYPEFSQLEERIDNCFTVSMLEDCLREYIETLAGTIQTVQENKASKPIRIAQEYISKNADKPITLNEVAEIVHYSPNYFSNAFKTQTGKTFLDYLTDLRIEKAKSLLKDTPLKISDIAHTVGYADEKYFSKLFLRIVGVKPVEYRKFYS